MYGLRGLVGPYAAVLVAGCWTDIGHQRIPMQTFYQWLDAIVYPDPAGLPYVLARQGGNGQHPMHDDVLPTTFQQNVNNAVNLGAFEPRNSTGYLLPGDYFLFRLTPQRTLQRVLPNLKPTPITSRTVTRGATGTRTPRNSRSKMVRN
ncbi:hypothetical protein B0H14DRAFT_3881042, partial [Mycena olivaceomarginata]